MILMPHAFDFGSQGPVYEFEFYDGTPLDLEETGAYLEHKKVMLKPRQRHIDKEKQAHMKDILRGWRANEYVKWIYLTGTYRDQLGQTWIRGYQTAQDGDVVDYIFNSTYWSWY